MALTSLRLAFLSRMLWTTARAGIMLSAISGGMPVRSSGTLAHVGQRGYLADIGEYLHCSGYCHVEQVKLLLFGPRGLRHRVRALGTLRAEQEHVLRLKALRLVDGAQA